MVLPADGARRFRPIGSCSTRVRTQVGRQLGVLWKAARTGAAVSDSHASRLSWRDETGARHLGLSGHILMNPLGSPNQYAANSRLASVVGKSPLGDDMQGVPVPTNDGHCTLSLTPLSSPIAVQSNTSHDRRQDVMLWRSPQEMLQAFLRAEDYFSDQGTYAERLSSREARAFWNRPGGVIGWRPANGMDVGHVRFVTVALMLLHPLGDKPMFKMLPLPAGDVRWAISHAGSATCPGRGTQQTTSVALRSSGHTSSRRRACVNWWGTFWTACQTS